MRKGKKYVESAKLVDRSKLYDPAEALDTVVKTAKAKFDETVEIHVRLGVDSRHADQQVRGAIVLPNGTGKQVRVLVFAKGDQAAAAEEAGAEFVGAEDLVTRIQKENFFDYDVVIAAPNMMGLVGRLGRVLGPKGLMPNPKAGTVTMDVAKAVKAAGAQLLRGGAFKPRTSPYDFQGLHGEGIRLLEIAKQETGLPIVTELMNIKHLPLFENVDVIQIGARNMQNYDLLKEMGSVKKPILLKRGLANTLKELLMSAEYIMASGNDNVILCERGIRTFDDYTRNTLDLAAVPMLHELSHLPVIVDPSHSTGINRLVPPMTLAAAACGADGVIVEVHNDPIHAQCDGAQSLTCEQFAEVARKVRAVRKAVAE